MQNLKDFIKEDRSKNPSISIQELENKAREYLQILVLKSIYHSKFGSVLSFMGGTCLRVCYHLKRYSEDLDFAMDKKNKGYSFDKLVEIVIKDMTMSGFKIEANIDSEGIVQKTFLKFSEVLQTLGISKREGQKLHIKLEIDTNPVKIGNNQMESFFVNKFNEIFPILKHKKETLFAGKLLAILCRAYAKGRDYYDLIWHLSQRTPVDMIYLNDGISQFNKSQKNQTHIQNFKTASEVFDRLKRLIDEVHASIILKDVGRFLEDPSEERWIKDYPKVFDQFVTAYFG